jgi:prolyl-tRNA editing enzyme YbaK/EbsC (Cys-tRNA(Pro) deacylase)
MKREPAKELAGLLDEAQVPYELLHHRRTETAAGEAHALGVSPSEVGKTLVLTTAEGFARVVLPASERLDLHEAARVLGTKDVHLATEEILAKEYPEFELGTIPPFGGSHEDRVLVDARLLSADSVVLEAGTHDESIRLSIADLLTLAAADVADLCRD